MVAVVETVRENSSCFLPTLVMNEIGEDWIAKSSHMQVTSNSMRPILWLMMPESLTGLYHFIRARSAAAALAARALAAATRS